MRIHWSSVLLILLATRATAAPMIFKVTVNDMDRQALVFPGTHARAIPSPVVFAFHGFGGSPLSMAATKIHEAWPEATVVYPLGSPAYSKRAEKEVRAWQGGPGRDGGRDVEFIDVLLVDLQRTLEVDDRRIYAAGLSNGALFCGILLLERPNVFAGFAFVAGAADFVRDATVPRPVMMIHGKADTTVKPEAARRTRDLWRKLNGCGNRQVEWAPGYLNYQPCTSGQPVIWRLHNGGHRWPGDATEMIVRFFQELTET
jgi:polyhydroxybutyrate depolymerase